MKVAVAGGTGHVGRYMVAALTASGHEPVVLARATGVDLITGLGLDEALEGADAVVDASNKVTMSARASRAFFGTVTANLLAARARAGLGHYVALSIVGIDDVDYGYYLGKRLQEELVLASDGPVSILRATQFHEFAGQMLAAVPGPVAAIPHMQTQPVAAREVGAALAELAVGPAVGRAPDLGGPHVERLADMARKTLRAQGSHRAVVQFPMPGTVGKKMAGGALLLGPDGRRGTQSFDEWLASPDGPAAHRQ